MNTLDYYDKHYKQTVIDGPDKLTIDKPSGDDWVHIEMDVNGGCADSVTIRSQEQLEQLHFLIGQLLGK